jgi:PAS domain-containing protein
VDTIKSIIENYGTITAVVVGLFTFIARCRRYIKNAIRSFVLGDRFHVVFGDSPAEAIKAIHDAIQTSYEVCELRQQITERNIQIGIFICDTKGRCTWSNSYLNELFCLDSKDMMGFGWLQAIKASDRKRVNDHWLYSIQHDIAYDCDYTIVNKRDSILVDITSTAMAVKDDTGTVQCYLGYIKVNAIRGTNGDLLRHEGENSVGILHRNNDKEDS